MSRRTNLWRKRVLQATQLTVGQRMISSKTKNHGGIIQTMPANRELVLVALGRVSPTNMSGEKRERIVARLSRSKKDS